MDFKIPSAELKRLLKKLSPARSSTLVFDPENGQMIAADDSLGITLSHPVFRQSGSRLAVPTKSFTSVVGGLSGEIHVFEDGSQLRVETGKAQFRISTIPPKPFNVADVSETKFFWPTKEFGAAVSYACSAAEEKQSFDFTGYVLLDVNEGFLRASGTDKKRLATYKSSLPAEANLRSLVSVRAVQAIKELGGDQIAYCQLERTQVFTSNNIRVYDRLVAEDDKKKFPAPEQYIPTTFQTEVRIDSSLLREALCRLASAVDSEKPKIKFEFSGDNLSLSVVSSEVKATDSLPVNTIVPDVFDEPFPLVTTLNHNDVLQFLEAISGSVTLKANTHRSPVLWECGKYRLLGMPFA